MLYKGKNGTTIGDTAVINEKIGAYFTAHGHEQTADGKFKCTLDELGLDKYSLTFFSQLVDALESDDKAIKKAVGGIFDEAHYGDKENQDKTVARLTQEIRSEMFAGEDVDMDVLTRCVTDAVCLEPPYQEYFSEPYLVKVRLPMELAPDEAEAIVVDYGNLRTRNQLCGEIRFESAGPAREDSSQHYWDLYGDISLEGVIRIVQRIGSESNKEDAEPLAMVRMPAGTLAVRDDGRGYRLSTGITFPLEDVEVFSIGYYDD